MEMIFLLQIVTLIRKLSISSAFSLCIKSLIAVSYINKAFIFWHLNASLLSCCKVTQVKPFAWISLKGKSNGLPYNAILHIKSYIYKMLFRFSPFVLNMLSLLFQPHYILAICITKMECTLIPINFLLE